MADANELGRRARVRAAGMAGLLMEVKASNAARDLDPDLLDRIDMALEDQEQAVQDAAVSAPAKEEAPNQHQQEKQG